MKAALIVSNLSILSALLDEITHQVEREAETLEGSVVSSFDFVKMTLTDKRAGQLFAQIELKRTKEERLEIQSVYCTEPSRDVPIREILAARPLAWVEDDPTADLPSDVLAALALADEIASLAQNASSGDDYRPGHYTEVSLDKRAIRLRQINRHNSRSSAHKDNYLMRELHFFIPLAPGPVPPGTHRSGLLHIDFSDLSSPPNRTVGDDIKSKLAPFAI